MNTNNNRPFADDFLKKMVGLEHEELLPEDFTLKVMAGLPAAEVKTETIGKYSVFKIAVSIGVLILVTGFLLFYIDFGSIIHAISLPSANNPAGYLNIFSTIIKTFSEGFSSIRLTSITMVAILSLASLFFLDKLLRRITDGPSHAI